MPTGFREFSAGPLPGVHGQGGRYTVYSAGVSSAPNTMSVAIVHGGSARGSAVVLVRSLEARVGDAPGDPRGWILVSPTLADQGSTPADSPGVVDRIGELLARLGEVIRDSGDAPVAGIGLGRHRSWATAAIDGAFVQALRSLPTGSGALRSTAFAALDGRLEAPGAILTPDAANTVSSAVLGWLAQPGPPGFTAFDFAGDGVPT